MKTILGFTAGVVLTVSVFAFGAHPKYSQTATGWKLEHIPVPPCKDGWTRSVDLPERDEVDAMAVTCAAHLPDASLDLDAQGRTIN
jgi:hypothetical protein